MHIVVDEKSTQESDIYVAISIVNDVKFWTVAVFFRDHWCGYIGVNRGMWNACNRIIDRDTENKFMLTFEGIGNAAVHNIKLDLLRRFEIELPDYWLGFDWAKEASMTSDDVFVELDGKIQIYLTLLERAYQHLVQEA